MSKRHGRSRKLPQEWQHYQRKKGSSRGWQYGIAAFAVCTSGAALLLFMPLTGSSPDLTMEDASPVQTLFAQGSASPSTAPHSRTFSFCHTGGGTNCVVDGDTLWMDGVKIRIADIDAPETHPARCPREADLGNRATKRLLELVNDGPFEALPVGSRDEDKYGRKLRVLVRSGRSLGDILVKEGLARTWNGSRHSWC